jgi:uncharacterized membrane protein
VSRRVRTIDNALTRTTIAGAVGAVIGTLGGRVVRGRLATAFGSDRPAAFLEDAVAIGAALLVIMALP